MKENTHNKEGIAVEREKSICSFFSHLSFFTGVRKKMKKNTNKRKKKAYVGGDKFVKRERENTRGNLICREGKIYM